jgi:predicted aldo/keto reductase-like oxidoreductase
MQYTDFKDLKISRLGFGAMRLPMDAEGKIIAGTVQEMVDYAMANGINYFDTAYIYPGSESALGEILSKNNIREKVNIATKLPHSFIKNKETMENIFNEELSRLKTDYIDYYLMHMLTDVDTWQRLVDMGILKVRHQVF